MSLHAFVVLRRKLILILSKDVFIPDIREYDRCDPWKKVPIAQNTGLEDDMGLDSLESTIGRVYRIMVRSPSFLPEIAVA